MNTESSKTWITLTPSDLANNELIGKRCKFIRPNGALAREGLITTLERDRERIGIEYDGCSGKQPDWMTLNVAGWSAQALITREAVAPDRPIQVGDTIEVTAKQISTDPEVGARFKVLELASRDRGVLIAHDVFVNWFMSYKQIKRVEPAAIAPEAPKLDSSELKAGDTIEIVYRNFHKDPAVGSRFKVERVRTSDRAALIKHGDSDDYPMYVNQYKRVEPAPKQGERGFAIGDMIEVTRKISRSDPEVGTRFGITGISQYGSPMIRHGVSGHHPMYESQIKHVEPVATSEAPGGLWRAITSAEVTSSLVGKLGRFVRDDGSISQEGEIQKIGDVAWASDAVWINGSWLSASAQSGWKVQIFEPASEAAPREPAPRSEPAPERITKLSYEDAQKLVGKAVRVYESSGALRETSKVLEARPLATGSRIETQLHYLDLDDSSWYSIEVEDPNWRTSSEPASEAPKPERISKLLYTDAKGLINKEVRVYRQNGQLLKTGLVEAAYPSIRNGVKWSRVQVNGSDVVWLNGDDGQEHTIEVVDPNWKQSSEPQAMAAPQPVNGPRSTFKLRVEGSIVLDVDTDSEHACGLDVNGNGVIPIRYKVEIGCSKLNDKTTFVLDNRDITEYFLELQRTSLEEADVTESCEVLCENAAKEFYSRLEPGACTHVTVRIWGGPNASVECRYGG